MIKRRNFLAAAAAAPAAIALPATAQIARPACLPGWSAIPTRNASKIEIVYKTKHGQPNGLGLASTPGQMWVLDQGAGHWVTLINISDGSTAREFQADVVGPSGLVQDGVLVLAHSNFPQVPMASSVEFFDPATLRPVRSLSLGLRHGSLTWAERRGGDWWACFAHYNDQGFEPGRDQRWTHVARFDADWQIRESWLFPPQVVATWGKSSCSGGSWGPDGLLYVTGHDARELYVLRLPRMGSVLEYVTTIDVPFEGQSWAWDPVEERTIYGIVRRTREVVVARIPALPDSLRSR
jgi:hypothetical protein